MGQKGLELSTAVPHYYYGKESVYILITVGKKIELEGKDRATHFGYYSKLWYT